MDKGVDSGTEGLSLQKNIAWYSVGNFSYLLSQWLFTYIVTNALGFDSAGVYSLAVSISSSFYMIATYTMRNFQASDVSRSYSDMTYVASRYATCAISILCCLVFTALNGYSTSTFLCVMLFMLFKITEALSDVYQGVVQLRMRMDYIGRSFIIKSVIELAVFSAALYILGNLVFALSALFISSAMIVSLYDAPKARLFYEKSAVDLSAVLRLLLTCLPAAAYGMLFTAAGQLPRYFIEGRLGEEALGFYSSIAMPVAIIQVSASFIFSPLATPLAEALERGDNHAFWKTVRPVFIAIGLIAAAGTVGFAVFGSWFYTLLFEQKIIPYVPLAVPLAFCSVLVALCWFLATVLTVMRKLRLLVGLSIIAFAITLLGSIPFIDSFGMNGATLIYIASLAVFAVGCLGSIVASTHEAVKDGTSCSDSTDAE